MPIKEESRKSKLLGTDIIFMNLPYLFFLALLGVIYISNTHSAEAKLRKVELLKTEIKEAKWEYINIQQKIMHGSTQTELQNKMRASDLNENRSIPKKIIVDRS